MSDLPRPAHRVYERTLLVTPEPVRLATVTVVTRQLQSPASDVHHRGHPHLANPHLVHHLQLHADLEDALDTLVDNFVKISWQRPSSSQLLDQKLFPVLIFVLNSFGRYERFPLSSAPPDWVNCFTAQV